jgi:cytochrome c oxidase subunit IV
MADAQGMAEAHEEHTYGHHVWYFGVFLALCFLTLVSVASDLVHINSRLIGGINVLLATLVLSVAAAKAMFVMMFFMHLRFEGRWKFLLLSPTLILALGLPLALLPDVGRHYYTTDVPQSTARVTDINGPASAPDERQREFSE